RRVGQPLQEPAALVRAEHRAAWIDTSRTVAGRRLIDFLTERDLGRAVLAGVENEERRETAVRKASVELEVGALRPRRTHRHVLVEQLIARRSFRDRGIVASDLLADDACIVLLPLVLIP